MLERNERELIFYNLICATNALSHTLSLKLGGEGLIIILNGGSSFIIVTHGSRQGKNITN